MTKFRFFIPKVLGALFFWQYATIFIGLLALVSTPTAINNYFEYKTNVTITELRTQVNNLSEEQKETSQSPQ